VKATLSGTTYTLDNGLVQAKVNTSDATMPSFIINGVETMNPGGYFSWGTNVYTAGPFTGSLSADPSKNGGDVAEVAMTYDMGQELWKNSIGSGSPLCLAPLFVGLYGYVVLTHPASYPAFTPGELRYNHYVQWDSVFDGYAVDDVRRGSSRQWRPRRLPRRSRVHPRRCSSTRRDHSPTGRAGRSTTTARNGAKGTVYGWKQQQKNIGLWMINPSNEYLPAAP